MARGIAIVTMLWATLSPYTLVSPHPLWLRLISSIAAPVFVGVAGMMVSRTAAAAGHDLRFFCLRGASLVAVAIAIDLVVWEQWPIFSFDVLYLIGLGMPLVYLSLRLRPSWRFLLTVIVLLMSPYLQGSLGYPITPRQPKLTTALDDVFALLPLLDDHALVGGFFPIFPWFGVMLAGSLVGSWRYQSPEPRRMRGGKRVAVAALLLAFGFAAWFADSGPMWVRCGFSEVFYPPTLGYLALAIGMVVAVLVFSEHFQAAPLLAPLCRLGRASLFAYWLHLALVDAVVRNWCEPRGLTSFLLTYVASLGILYAAVTFLGTQQMRVAKLPSVVRVLFA